MDLVFSTDQIAQSKRFASWRDAICDVYVHVDVDATDPEDYVGFIREAQFGAVAVTDILLSRQQISRRPHHLSELDKDCYYVQFIQQGKMNVLQSGMALATNSALGGIFCANEPYELECIGQVRSYYLEIPREEFASRFSADRVPLAATMNSSRGLGRIAVEFCSMLASEGAALDAGVRSRLGEELMDVLALAIDAGDLGESGSEGAVQQARLRSVKAWIEEHLEEPTLTLEKIARCNDISLRYLHLLFKQTGMSVSDWVWDRRLNRCYELLAKGQQRSVTAIAYQLGFSSSSHFSTAFRRKFGLTPSDVRRGRLTGLPQ